MKVKKFLNRVLEEELEPIRTRRLEYAGRIEEVYEMLKQNSIEARREAADTLERMKAAMKINYFEDADFLKDWNARG